MHPVAIDPRSGLSVDSPQFRKRAPHLTLSEDPDTATAQTVQEMCRLIHEAAQNPFIREIALNAAQNIRGGPAWVRSTLDWDHPRRMAESCFWWCKFSLRFKHHGRMFEVWSAELGDPSNKIQLLIAPDVLVRMRRMEGDCAIYTMMVCALLESLGLEWEICPAAVDHSQPTIFSHVFARVVLPDGRESLDASHGPYPGWQVPAQDLLRLWVFDMNGNRAQERFSGLHDYRRSRGMGAIVCDDSGCYDDGTGTDFGPLCPAGMIQSGTSCISTGDTPAPYGGHPVYTAPARSSSQWADFATQLAKMGFTLAQINSIQPGTVVGSNGQILRQNPGYSVPVGTAASLNLGSSSNVLIYGALGLFAIFAFSSMFKGGR